jgi:hypothetical protein
MSETRYRGGTDGRELSHVDALELYFRPGRIVEGYGGGLDKVLQFKREGAKWGGGWEVEVVRVGPDRRDLPHERPRWHATEPEAERVERVLRAEGVVVEEKRVAARRVNGRERTAAGDRLDVMMDAQDLEASRFKEQARTVEERSTDGAPTARCYRVWILGHEDWRAMQDAGWTGGGASDAVRPGASEAELALVRRGVQRTEVVLRSCQSVEDVFAVMNGQGAGFPPGYRGRSLSTGDIVWDPEGRGWVCAPVGWRELQGLRLPEKALKPVPALPGAPTARGADARASSVVAGRAEEAARGLDPAARHHLEDAIWDASPPDYRTVMETGERAFLMLDSKNGATVLAPLRTLGDEELQNLGVKRGVRRPAGPQSKAFEAGYRDGLGWDLGDYATAKDVRAERRGWDDASLQAMGVRDFCQHVGLRTEEAHPDSIKLGVACREYNAGAYAGACAPQNERTGMSPGRERARDAPRAVADLARADPDPFER